MDYSPLKSAATLTRFHRNWGRICVVLNFTARCKECDIVIEDIRLQKPQTATHGKNRASLVQNDVASWAEFIELVLARTFGSINRHGPRSGIWTPG